MGHRDLIQEVWAQRLLQQRIVARDYDRFRAGTYRLITPLSAFLFVFAVTVWTDEASFLAASTLIHSASLQSHLGTNPLDNLLQSADND